jgi:membrane protein
MFFGAEFTKVFANRYGSGIRPAPIAVPITDEARSEQGIPHKSELEDKQPT